MKNFAFKIDSLTNEEYYEVNLRGSGLINDPFLNKGAAFTYEERLSLGLDGLLREKISPIKEQIARSYEAYNRKHNDMEKYIFLQGLLNRNEVLFYRLLMENLKEMLPIVYTPTVGQACIEMSHITRRYRGLYISPENIHNIDRICKNVHLPQINLIVVTDGERILGLGDLGSDGMGIPIGKVNLYVAAGGLNPACCLPVTLDVGTNNPRILNDPLYLGMQKPRLTGDEYFEFVEKFVIGVKRNFPDALLQWEDFAKHKAFELFQKYQNRILSFNDDIQGTGAVTLGALISAMRMKKADFHQQKFIIVGMGQAGAGIGFNIRNMLMEEGLSGEEINKRIFAIDVDGLITDDMPNLENQMQMFAQKRANIADWKLENSNKINLKDVIRNSKATTLIGVTAMPQLFDNEVLSLMAENDERPIIFALSNPTSKTECKASDVYTATKGRGIYASGSPFDPIHGEYGTMVTSQCNNMYLFPGIGLGALISNTPIITRMMFLAASRELSNMVPDDELQSGKLLPDMNNIREVSARIATAVAIEARNSGLGRLLSDEKYGVMVRKAQWQADYVPFRPGKLEK